MTELLLLLAEIVLYFVTLAALFRLRHALGIGAFICAIGAFHFLETYLAATFYVRVPFDIVLSPGSAILFVGKLFMLLLLYIREDATAVRQPIYGLFAANLIIVALCFVLRQHEAIATVPGRVPDYSFMQEMGGLMVWGTALLLLDCIFVVLLYERLSGLRLHPTLRIFASAAAVLTFDQCGFYLGLYFVFGAPLEVLVGGWVAKMASASVFSVLAGLYLRRFEGDREKRPHRRIADVFDILTYRERYESLLQQWGRDGLTGLPDRSTLERTGAGLVADAVGRGGPVSLLVVDIDHFKSFNDRLGHSAGDRVLRQVAEMILACSVDDEKHCFRYGGEEFVLLCEGLGHEMALRRADRIRRSVTAMDIVVAGHALTVSIGVATGPADGRDFWALFDCADRRLYEAKEAGRDQVVGRAPQAGEEARKSMAT